MLRRTLLSLLTAAALALLAPVASALPEAHILRIDPRAGVSAGAPEVTTVVEVIQATPLGELVTHSGCSGAKGNAAYECLSNAVETPNKLWKPFPFPEANARLFVRVAGQEVPAKFVSKATWAQSMKDPLVGTAWLIALDASSMMGARYADAREVANQFLGALGPNDLAKLIIFDDRISPYVASSKWVAAKDKGQLIDVLKQFPSASPSHGRDRPLFAQLKNITRAFMDIGNAGEVQAVPMHQAMVLLSNGAGRQDAGSAAQGGEVMKSYFNAGRFPEDNTAAPKTPLPVISVFFPNSRDGLMNNVYASTDFQFMQDLSNPEIGGFFDIVLAGQGYAKAQKIVSIVKKRFNDMWVVKWRLSCLSPTVEQSFNLIFQNTTPPIKPDGSFKDVPLGVNPAEWPLDVNKQQTEADALANPVYPGGTFRVFGDFCWAGNKGRAEAYFVPAGTNPNQNINKNDPEIAKKAMQQLIAQNMRGGADETSDTFVTFQVPDDPKILEGNGDQMVARVVVYDNEAKRASGYEPTTILTLKARKRPLNLPLVLGGVGGLVVVILLVVVLLRSGGKKGGGGGGTPQPVAAPGGYGAPPYGGGGAPPYGGGAPPYGGGAPPYGGGGAPPYGGGGGYGAAPPQASVAPPAAGAGGYPLA